MTGSDSKADLQRYLQTARDALLWKLDGLSEYDLRRSSTGPWGCAKATTTWLQETRSGGRATGADWKTWRGKSIESELGS
ncbi:MAG: hypothetical protein ACRDJT_11030 [Actinomycetota bacterium]